MYYQSNAGLMAFIDTRGSSEAIKISSKIKNKAPFRGRILNIDKDTDRKSFSEAALFEFTLKSFGYEVTTVFTLQAAVVEISKASFDYYVMDTFKYLDTTSNPMQLLLEFHSEVNPNKKINLINHTSTSVPISWQVPGDINYVTRWSKKSSLNSLMTSLARLTASIAPRTKRVSKEKSLEQSSAPELNL